MHVAAENWSADCCLPSLNLLSPCGLDLFATDALFWLHFKDENIRLVAWDSVAAPQPPSTSAVSIFV